MLNRICIQTELNSGSKDSALTLHACRRASVQVFVYRSSQHRSRPSYPQSQLSSTHFMPGEGALLSCHRGGQRSAAGGIS